MTRSRLIGAAVVLALVVFLLLWGPAACNAIRSLTVQNRVNQGQSDALTNSARDAIGTQGDVAGNATASEDTTRSNERNIRDAKGADAQVDPAVRDAGFASLCKRPSFRNSPSGRLRCPAASGVAPAR